MFSKGIKKESYIDDVFPEGNIYAEGRQSTTAELSTRRRRARGTLFNHLDMDGFSPNSSFILIWMSLERTRGVPG